MRFIECAIGDHKLPSPLYYQSGGAFKTVRISSRRPSPRIKAVGGVVNFWDKKPELAADDKDKKKGKKKEDAEADVPPPALSLEVPSGSKMLGILIPHKDLKKTKALYLNEKDFGKKGVHVVNLSPYTMKISLSEKGDFSDKKDSVIKPYDGRGITSENSWQFKGGKDGEQMSFILAYNKPHTKEFVNIKASRFVVSARQSQINFVVKGAAEGARPTLLSAQLTD